ncbi:MAG: hypothetical protein H6Q60_535 [Oscillospiraceae bacterium]|nr:hypothetical protein [Oscillospiraceae bacterium]
MDRTVIISIKGTQSFDEDSPEVIELVTEGTLAECGDEGFALTYQESKLTGLEGTLTTFHVEKERITLMRVGEVNSQMVFEPGRRHLSIYDTPFGALSVGISTYKMSSSLDENGGDIELSYAIEIDHAIAGENSFQINVRQARPYTLSQ